MNELVGITPEQLQASGAWTEAGEHMAAVTLRLEEGALTVTQGDERATFDREGIEVGD